MSINTTTICPKIQLKKKLPNNNEYFISKIVVDYECKSYLILIIKTEISKQLMEIPILIDYEDYLKIKDIRWQINDNYISYTFIDDKRISYFHQFIMGHSSALDDEKSVYHINLIHQDNRKANLRLTSQQVEKKKRKRTLKLPEGCGIEPNDIPTHIDYHPENGNHGDYFEVSIKTDNIYVFRKNTTKSKKSTLIQKLNQAKIILKDLMNEKPELLGDYFANGNLTDEGNSLYESYFKILKRGGIEDPLNTYITTELRIVKLLNIDENDCSKTRIKNMPKIETGITCLPLNCRYINENKIRGDYFEYDVKQKDSRITYRTSTSKLVSTKDKFNELIKILETKNLLKIDVNSSITDKSNNINDLVSNVCENIADTIIQ